MLLSFNFSNFHSFSDETEFVMSAGPTKRHLSHIANIKDVDILKYSAIYGANAAGKTSLIKALNATRNMICGESIDTYSNEYCRCDPENKKRMSKFEYFFETEQHFYQFGFNVILSKKEFVSEWLYEVAPDMNSETLIYSIEKKDGRIIPNWNLFVENDEIKRLEQILNDSSEEIDENEESVENYSTLFISKMKGKKFNDLPNLEILRKAYKWFHNKLIVDRLSSPSTNEEFAEVCKYLSLYDTNIVGGEYRLETDMSELFSPQMKTNLTDTMLSTSGVKIAVENGAINVYSIHTKHNSSDEDYSILDESNGTIKAMDLIFTLFCDKYDDVTYIIDEFGNSMHPLLVQKLLQDYQELNADKINQIIMTTHHTSIMSLDYLRRDEFWFIDKQDGVSKIYSLEDFTERPDAEISKRYLEGRYGALPVFDQITDSKE